MVAVLAFIVLGRWSLGAIELNLRSSGTCSAKSSISVSSAS
jgi:hypothetical protein